MYKYIIKMVRYLSNNYIKLGDNIKMGLKLKVILYFLVGINI